VTPVADDVRERLLASYAHMGEAMVVQNVLQAGGVPCRIADLEQIPTHVLGMAGALGRSVGLWVLEMDVERATSLLSTMAATDAAVDEEALAAEALSATAPAPARVRPARTSVAPSPWFVRPMVVLVAGMAALLAWRGCR
jgi:Putative prokaryotic signal transducing protein